MEAINWVGKEQNSGRVGRGSAGVPVCETRWIVPARPYQAPKGSRERMENTVLMIAAVAAIVIVYAGMIIAEMGAL